MLRYVLGALSTHYSGGRSDGQSSTIASTTGRSVRRRFVRMFVCLFVALLASVSIIVGQGLTGQLAGSVVDPGTNLIVGATLRLTNAVTGQTREMVTDNRGDFVFTNLLPGIYHLRVSHQGFQTYEQKEIEVAANERVALRQIQLEIGEMTQQVTVMSEEARLQTQSSERSGLITSTQLTNAPTKARDYLGMVALLPGVTNTANREAPGEGGTGLVVNGGQTGIINLTIDGITALDTGATNRRYISPSTDAIGEVKVLLSNYQAEYGRSSGGTINAVIKSGTREFHGTGYYYKRNEAFNANEFFNNASGIARPLYRFDYPGFNIGGPISFIPGINRSKDKLFFFFSQEWLIRKVPTDLTRITVPTARERQGDFSQSFGTNGQLLLIRDPEKGLPCTTANTSGCFPRNIIPSDQLDPVGQAFLNLFPLPNATDPGRAFNYVDQQTIDRPRDENILRIDWNVAPSTVFYARGIRDYEAQKGPWSTTVDNGNFGQLPISYTVQSAGLVSTVIHSFRPTLINEFTFGVNRAFQNVTASAADLTWNNRNTINFPQFFPAANPAEIIPDATFAGGVISNPAAFTMENRFPFFGTNNIWNWSNNLTWVKKSHNFKFGIYLERTTRNAARATEFNGNLSFNNNSNNPLDANHGFANALLGVVNSYTESDKHPIAHGRFMNIEWFAQDSWKVRPRLTLEVGIRFQILKPTISAGDDLAVFDASLYDPGQAALLNQPYCLTSNPCSGANRVGRNPVTGAIVPSAQIGRFSDGSGEFYQGMRIYHEGVLNNPGVNLGPRFGFGYDVFGNGKMAIRGGFGVFYDRNGGDDAILQLVQSPPLVNTPSTAFTTVPQLLAAPLAFGPADVFAVEQDYHSPTVYHYSLGIQRDIGFGTVLDVAYVGNVTRHFSRNFNLNAVPYGMNFQASSIDRTVSGGATPLDSALLRPVRGHGNITLAAFDGNSRFHSLQTTVNRRFGRRLMFGSTWTWSKVLDYGNRLPFRPDRDNFGKPNTDRTHNLTANWNYALPKVSNRWKTGFAKLLLDGWEYSGIASFISGTPQNITYAVTGNANPTGGVGLTQRVNLIADPIRSKEEQTDLQSGLDIDAVRMPTPDQFGFGNAPKDAFRGPGTNNWDMSLTKTFQLGARESRRLLFRFETYNTFNHTQFTMVETQARFNNAGVLTNAPISPTAISGFGQYIAAADGRRIVLTLKLYF